jgi:glycosyltransferase involved in cell wall biosynthesis
MATPTIIPVPRVLVLARHFPPMGGAGVHRTLGSVRHLPAHGYDPVVVTGPERATSRNRWEPTDPALLDRLPADVEIHQLPDTQPAADVSRLGRVLDVRPPLVRWWIQESVRVGQAVGRGADVVLASCAPYETAFAAARVAQAVGVPWIADLEDPWALDEMRVRPTALHRAADLRRMWRALDSAAAIVMSAPEAAERLKRAFPELAARVIVAGVEIGYEPADFAGVPGREPDGTFRIVHTGSLHTDFGEHLRRSRVRRRILGGSVAGLDVLTRSHVFLVRAIEKLRRDDPALGERVELHLAGELTPADRAVSDHHDFVRHVGLLSHDEAVRLTRSADLLFLPMHDMPAGSRAGLIPYKTYDYLASGRPILAAVPDGDVRDMLDPLRQATLVRPDDVDAMAAALGARIAAAPVRDVAPPARYERRRSVARIAAVLDAVRPRSAVVPQLVQEAK